MLFFARRNDLQQKMQVPLSWEEKDAVFLHFEDECNRLTHKTCKTCASVGLSMEIGNSGNCSTCNTMKEELHSFLPTWTDEEGHVHYTVPEVLSGLTIAEKMLIQQVSPFIPLQHIRHGIFGLSGHVCCFEQDVNGFVQSLPRKPDDVSVIKIIKTIKAEIGGDAETNKAFLVRKNAVLEA